MYSLILWLSSHSGCPQYSTMLDGRQIGELHLLNHGCVWNGGDNYSVVDVLSDGEVE